jgi:hypothetical protein
MGDCSLLRRGAAIGESYPEIERNMLPLSSRFQGPAAIIIDLELLNIKATLHYETS